MKFTEIEYGYIVIRVVIVPIVMVVPMQYAINAVYADVDSLT